MAYVLPNGHVTDDVMWPWKVKLLTPMRIESNISKTTWARDLKFGMQICIGIRECRAGAQIIFPESGRGLCHVTPTVFGEHISKTTWARDFKFGTRLCMGNDVEAHKKFPQSGRGLRHVTLQLLAFDRKYHNLQNYLS